MSTSRRGMNLLEITIVLLVVGIMAAVVSPRFTHSVRASQLKAARMQTRATIDYVRRVAINEGRTTTITFDTLNDTITSPNVEAPGFVGTMISLDIHADFDDSIELLADFDGATTLSFDFEGVPWVGNTKMQSGTIQLQSIDDVLAIQITPELGTTTLGSGAVTDSIEGTDDGYTDGYGDPYDNGFGESQL